MKRSLPWQSNEQLNRKGETRALLFLFGDGASMSRKLAVVEPYLAETHREKIRKAAEKGAGRASIKGMHEPKVPEVIRGDKKMK